MEVGMTEDEAASYREIGELLSLALQDPEFPQVPLRRFQITQQASGEVGWQAHAVDDVEPVAGYIPSEMPTEYPTTHGAVQRSTGDFSASNGPEVSDD
jgi:hypothetical protein